MEQMQTNNSMPCVNVGQRISIGPRQIPAIVCNEIPMPEDAFGKRYFVVCKSGQGVRARDGRRLGEDVLVTVLWNGADWAVKEAGFRVSEVMPWLKQYVQQLEGLLRLEAQEEDDQEPEVTNLN